MLNIDQLRYNYSKPFLHLVEGMETKQDMVNNIVFYKNNTQYFHLDTITNYINCNYKLVWSYLRDTCYFNADELREYLKYNMKKHYNLYIMPVQSN